MKCFNCNSEIADNNIFCPLCGTNLVQNNNIESINNINPNVPVEPNINNINPNVSGEPNINNINPNVSGEPIVNNYNEVPNASINEVVETPTVNPVNNVVETPNQVVTPLPTEAATNIVSPEMGNSTPIDVQTMVQPNMGVDLNPSYNVGFKEEGSIPVKGKSKLPVIIISVLVVVALAIGGFFGYKMLASPKKVFIGVLDKSSEFLSGFIDTRLYTSDTVTMDFDLKTTNKIVDEEMGPIFNIIKNIAFSGKAQIDYKNKNILIDFDSNYSNDELINLSAYVTNEKLYVDLKDLYDKKISTDVEGINELFKMNDYSKDLENIVGEAKNALNKSLKDEYFVKEKVKMNINGSEASVNKTILLLNYNNLKSLLKDVLNSLKVNNKFLDSLVNIISLDEEITKQEIVEEIDSFLELMNEETETPEGNIKLIIYTKGKNFAGFEVEDNISGTGSIFSIINDKKDIFTVKVNNGYSEQQFDIHVNGDVYTLKFEEDGTKAEFGLNLKNYDFEFKLSNIDMSLTASQKTNNDGKKNVVINFIVDENEIGIEMSYLYKYNEKVTIPSLTPSVNIDSIREEESKNILNNFLETQGVKDIIKDFEKISGNDFEIFENLFITNASLSNYNSCASAFGCDCGENDLMCTCNYFNEDGNVAADTVKCENPNYQNCPLGVNCLQYNNYNNYNEFSY